MTRLEQTLLIVEDDPGLQRQLKWCFGDEYQLVTAETQASAIAQLRRYEPAVVMLDLGLPPDPTNASEGLKTLSEILSLAPNTKVVVVTGNDDKKTAVQAVGMGAYDFYQKPADPELLGLILARAFRLHELEQENQVLSQVGEAAPLEGILANSPEMLAACRTVEKIAPTDVTSLILGESGTGKELLAQALHRLSPRAKGRFVAINCAAIPDTLLESELFGYERGAFTGAEKQTLGRIEYANSGTLFLDEVGDLPMTLQAKLLRFLQERVIERLGGRKEIPVDVRVVCATHRDLRQLIEEGKFREDLYYRISEVAVAVPPLRDRVGDTVLLARVFLQRYTKDYGKPIRGFSRDALAAIESHPWPGNVRELENRVRRAVIMSEGNQVTAACMELKTADDDLAFNLREVRESAERRAVIRAVSHANSNISRAAEILGITRPTLYSLLNKHSIKA